LIVGVVARAGSGAATWRLRRDRAPRDRLWAVLAAISVAGRLYGPNDSAGFLMSIVGAVIVVVIYQA